MTAQNVLDFAVKLKISETRPAAATFQDETRRHFEHLKGITGKDIELSQLMNHDDRISLVSGIPGIGKSVLTKQLALLWVNNKIYAQFKLCIVMECRDINYFAANEGSALEKHKLLSDFLRTKFEYDLKEGVSTLFICDGLDELADLKTADSVMWQLLDKKHTKYPKAKIIVTCRPHVEGQLERKDIDIGGLKRFEIQGLDDEQIGDYVKKFTSCEEDLVKINKAISSSKEHVKLATIPGFLNSLCCVALVSEKETLKSVAELYVWVLYLLLKEHVEKKGPSQKLCYEIFEEYSNELRALCKICSELLTENTIIFEGNVKSQLVESDKGTEFIEGLFVEVSDNRKQRFHFKHLTLMEFLSAVHICRMENRLEIIANNLRNEFHQLVFFICQLIGGCKYDGIIQDMFGNDEELRAINVQQFLPSVLELVCQQQQQPNQLFQLSIDIIMCFINEDVTKQEVYYFNCQSIAL